MISAARRCSGWWALAQVSSLITVKFSYSSQLRKNNRVVKDFSTPVQMHGIFSPVLTESRTNLLPVFKKNLKTFLFQSWFSCSSVILYVGLIFIAFSLSIFWQLLWAPPWWTFIRSSFSSLLLINAHHGGAQSNCQNIDIWNWIRIRQHII